MHVSPVAIREARAFSYFTKSQKYVILKVAKIKGGNICDETAESISGQQMEG